MAARHIDPAGHLAAEGWVELGPIVRLQIQRDSLKAGPKGARSYDPAPLLELESLYVTRDGVAADPDGRTLDVHNALHPTSKNVDGINGISVGFTSHYARMRAEYGKHLADGIAGENVLVATSRRVTIGEIGCGLRVLRADGCVLALSGVRVAHPCVEFSRFALADPDASPLAVTPVLQFLDDGVRGFYAAVESSDPVRLMIGDRVFGKGA